MTNGVERTPVTGTLEGDLLQGTGVVFCCFPSSASLVAAAPRF